MFKSFIVAAGLFIATQAQAVSLPEMLIAQQQNAIVQAVETQALNWKVGDTNNYNVDMGFIKGKMVMSVKSIVAEGIWIAQDMDLGFAGKQNAEMLIDPNTGETKKFLVGGKEQEIPKNNTEVISVVEDKITVPAGTFDCIHATLKNKDDNSEINAWINPQQIPISGMLKQVAPSQFGKVTVVLTSFKKN